MGRASSADTMNFRTQRDKINESNGDMVAANTPLLSAKDPNTTLHSKDFEVVSPTNSGRKQKSYLGPTPGERKLSDQRRNTIKESLGAFLSNKDTENDYTDETQEETVLYHARTSSRSTRPRPAHAQGNSTGPNTPRRSRSGGSIIAAMHSAGQAFTPQLPRRSMSGQAKAVGHQQPSKNNNNNNKASGRLDDPFIDALLGGTCVSTPSTHAMSYASTPSSRGNGSRKLWQGIGLDQFKEKMGYKKPQNTASSAEVKPTLGRNGRSRSFDAAETAAQAQDDSTNSKEGIGFGRGLMRRRSKSPSHLAEHVDAASERMNSRSVVDNSNTDKASIDRLHVSSQHTRSTCDTWECNPSSASGHGVRSMDMDYRPPRRIASEGVHNHHHGHTSLREKARHHSEHGPRSSVGPPVPPGEPPLSYTTTRPKLRRGKKSDLRDDSFYGLQLGIDLNDDSECRRVYGSKPRSPSSSHRRSQRSRSRDAPQRTKSGSKKNQAHGTTVRTPSSSSRRKSLRSRQHSPNSTTLTPSSFSSSQRRTISVDSADGWADLELDALEVDETDSIAASERQQQPFGGQATAIERQQQSFDGQVSYGEDFDTAMEVGENLMNLGVQLLTRGHDIRQTASRRNSLVESSHETYHVAAAAPRRNSMVESSYHGTLRAPANDSHQVDKYMAPSHHASPEENNFEVEVDREDNLGQTLNRMKLYQSTDHYDDTMRSQRSEIPRQVLCNNITSRHQEVEDDENDANSDIESLAGMLDQEDGKPKSSYSNRITADSSSASELGDSGNDISLNSLMMTDSGDDICEDELPDDDEMAAIMDGIHEDVTPIIRHRSHDPSSFRKYNESLNNNNKFEDSWRGLEFDFSDLGTPLATDAVKTKRDRKRVGRAKSAGDEKMRSSFARGSNKPQKKRSSAKKKAIQISSPPG